MPEIPTTKLTRQGEKAGAGWQRVTHGAHRHTRAADPHLSTLLAWASVLPREACFTQVTGAALLGLWLPPLPDSVPPVVQLPADAHPVRRPGVRTVRTCATGPPLLVRGLRVASVSDILLSLCRDFCDLDVLMAVDCALHRGLATEEELRIAAGLRRRGAPRLRRVLGLADHRAESPWESLLREFHRVADVPVTPQFEVLDADGRFVARGDLRLEGTRVLHEYDGGVHRDIEQHRADLWRDRRLQTAGWSRRGYTSKDLLHRTVELLKDVDRAVGRPHDPERLASWRAVLAGSTWTRTGRKQVWPRLAPPGC